MTDFQPEKEILEAMPDAVLIIGQDMRIHWMNPAARNMFRYVRGDKRNQKLGTLAKGMEVLQESIVLLKNQPGKLRGSDLLLDTGDKSDQAYGYYIFPLQQDFALILSPIASTQNTPNKDTDQQAISMLGRMLAHELKNPLAGIHGAAQLLETSLADAADMELTELIKSEVGRIGRLVSEMENFGQLAQGQKQYFNIHSVLRKALLLLQTNDNNNIEFIEDYDPSLPEVFGSEDQITQIAINLLDNAVQAIKSANTGKRIIIQTVYRNGVRKRMQNGHSLALPIEFKIIDDGPGIKEELKERIFQPFVTSKANGHGLGLALVAKIVNEHKGLIELRSRAGRTEFSVLLPAEPSNQGEQQDE